MKKPSTTMVIASSSRFILCLWRQLLLVVLVLAGVPTAGLAADDAASSATHTVIILHNNDLHFSFTCVDKIAETVQHFRDTYADVLLFNAGDFSIRRDRWEGKKIVTNAEQYTERLQFMVATMNRLGYDAVVPGNHDLGYEGTITRDYLKKMKFPVLGANVVVNTDNYITPQPFISRKLNSGLRLTVLGLCGGGFKADGVKLSSAQQAFTKYESLRDGCDLFVLLTHIGVSADRALADKYGDKIDAIVGGHTHTMLNPPELRNGVLIGQARDGYGRPTYLGAMRLIFDAAGKCIEKEGEVLEFKDGRLVKPSRFLEGSPAGSTVKRAA